MTNTKTLLSVIRKKMRVITRDFAHINNNQDNDQKFQNLADEMENSILENRDQRSGIYSKHGSQINWPQSARNNTTQSDGFTDLEEPINTDYLAKNKWPTKLLSLIHPFNMDDQTDENLEQFFNLNLPFLDFRIGIQGANEAFSFIISKEDQDFYSERDHIAKVIDMLRLSSFVRKEQSINKLPPSLVGMNFNTINYSPMKLGRFFNSENWKVSSYLSTQMASFFLNTMVAIVEFAESDIKIMIQ